MTYYIDNTEFHNALIARKQEINQYLVSMGLIDKSLLSALTHEERKVIIREVIERGYLLPKLSNYIGDCFLKLATNLSYDFRYQRYPYRDEMISDGIMDCIKYVDTFDPSKHNPFAYFTQAIKYAFWRRIDSEKFEGCKKLKLLQRYDLDIHSLQDHDEDGEFTNSFVEYINVYNSLDTTRYDTPSEKKERKYNGPSLEDFL